MDSYDNNMNTNAVYGTEETRRTGGNFDNTGSTGTGQTDRFDSSNTSGGYGQQDRFDNTGSNMGGGVGGGMTGSNMGTGMNDSSLGTARTDDLSSQGAGYGGTKGDEFSAGRNEFSSGNRDEFGSGNRTEFDGNKPTMGDKVKGGAEKLAGKVMGNAGMQERGQERKMGEFERNDF